MASVVTSNKGEDIPEKLGGTGISNELTKSPSISSISSIGSDSSTDALIRSLSTVNLLDKVDKRVEKTVKKIEGLSGITAVPTTISEKSEGIVSPETPVVSNGIKSPQLPKKAVKFTVRKVSHESTKTSNSRAVKSGNADQKKLDQLRRSQGKYDHYNSKINKIEKEINFLQNLLLPPQNYDVDFSTRNKIASAIVKLNNKKEEVEKKKYNIGISISRLWRFQDESDIWVRGFDKQARTGDKS